jgi:hypothetical protein
MKKQLSLSIVAVFAFGMLNAQTLNPANRSKTVLKLTKKSKQTSNTKVTAEGQDMNTRSDNSTTSVYDITALTAQGASAEIKITAMKIESESEANQMSYDSENPDDGNPQMGSVVQSAMKTPTKITLDANGFITAVKSNEKFESISKQSGIDGGFAKGNLLDIFLKLDKEVKIGDAWQEKKDTKEIKTTTDYKFTGMENGLANIEAVTELKLDKNIEQMGMTMNTKQEGKIVATLLVDPNTLIIKKKTTTMVLSGTVDAQGQTIPMSVFSNATETVE